MKVIHKLIAGFLSVALLIVITAWFSLSASEKALRTSIASHSVSLATGILDEIDRTLWGRIEAFQEYCGEESLRQWVSKSNRQFEDLDDMESYLTEMDQEWAASPKDVITASMQKILDNGLSQILKEKVGFYERQYGYRLFGEIFVTNRYGALIAGTGKTSDFRQDDEEWWQEAKNRGLYVQDVKYHESADVYSTDIGIRIDDGNGGFTGVMKVVLNIEEAIDIVKKLGKGKNRLSNNRTAFMLATADGRLIYSTRSFSRFEDVSRLLEHRHDMPESPGAGWTVIECSGNDIAECGLLSVHAHSAGYKNFKGLGWVLILDYETGEIFAPVQNLRNSIIGISAAVILLTVVLGLLFSRSVARPILKLRDAALRIGRGEMKTEISISSNDEIGQLAEALRQMAEDLSNTTTSIDNLEKSEKRFRSLVENSPTGILIVQDNQVVYYNPEMKRLLGVIPQESPFKDFSSIHPDDVERTRQHLQDVLKGKTIHTHVDMRIFPSGRTEDKADMRWVSLYASLIEYQDRESLMINMMDISRAKELEHLIRIDDKMASLGRVSAGIAHEMRNPLAGVNMYLAALKNLLENPEGADQEGLATAQDIISKLQSASDKMENVIRRVVDFSRPCSPRFMPVDLNKSIEGAVRLASTTLRKAEINLEQSLGQGLLMCYADSSLIEQVLLNIITNAIQAMRNLDGPKRLEITSSNDRDNVVITVSDSGPGVPQELTAKVFDPFYTTKNEGVGIGLSLCQRIISDHGGSIKVSVSKWGGAMFTIEIPCEKRRHPG